MRLFIVLCLLAFSINAFSSNWAEMELEKTYEINQNISLNYSARDGRKYEILSGDMFVLKDAYNLGFGVATLSFKSKNCPGDSVVTDMEIIPVENSMPAVEIGIYLEQNCELIVLVKEEEIHTKSLFKLNDTRKQF